MFQMADESEAWSDFLLQAAKDRKCTVPSNSWFCPPVVGMLLEDWPFSWLWDYFYSQCLLVLMCSVIPTTFSIECSPMLCRKSHEQVRDKVPILESLTGTERLR